MKTYPNIFKRDSTGAIRVWSMRLKVEGDIGYHCTHTGKLDGKMVESGWARCEPKNVGKKNATTSVEQAEAEIAANYAKKLELAYFADVEDIDNERYTDPMLAQTYSARASKFDIADGVYTQPKLDGIRCIARADGLFTRKGKPIVACPHIVESLADFFKRNPEAILDGELYNHVLKSDFNKIASIVRKAKPNAADTSRSQKYIQYHVYDWVHENAFKDRVSGVKDAVSYIDSEHVLMVPTVRVTTQDVLDSLYADWLEAGYEGQMVRLPDVHYEVGKRSNSLMKRKEFLSEEFKVAAIEEGNGNWAGAAKRFVLYHPDGRTFGAGVRGAKPVLEELLQKGRTPKWATLHYFTETPDGIPRFPVVVDWGFGGGRND